MKWLIERLVHLQPSSHSNQCKISRLDWWVYRLFYRRWSRIFEQRPDMARTFCEHLNQWVQAAEANQPADTPQAGKAAQEPGCAAKVIKFPRKRPKLTLVSPVNPAKTENSPESD